jgi:ParB family chromosome partitioning protein
MSTTLEHLDPASLLIETNVRADLGLDKAFIASIRDHGVLQPVVAVRTDQGVRVRMGQRRTAAAVEVGLPTIPVMVIDASGGDTDRIIEQLTENVHRAGLTDADTVTAVEQLALLGCTAANIAKRTKLPRQRVDQALIVSESDTSRTAVSNGLDLEQAAWLAEFEDDPDEHDRLTRAFTDRPEQARHDLERARRARRERDAATALLATLHAQYPNASAFQGNVYDDPKAKYLGDLKATPKAKDGIRPDEHQDCPGNAFQLRRAGYYNDTPELVHDGIGFDLLWLCTDFKAHGHLDRYKTPSSSTGPEPGTDEAKEQRRLTIALNKAGEAAKAVRVEWLTEFTINGYRNHKLLPVDWPDFMLASLTDSHLAADDKTRGLPKVLELLHLDTGSDELMVANRSSHVLLCARLWSHELHATREIWRQATLTSYLEYLELWGYTLSDVEKCGAGHIDPATAYTNLTEAAS